QALSKTEGVTEAGPGKPGEAYRAPVANSKSQTRSTSEIESDPGERRSDASQHLHLPARQNVGVKRHACRRPSQTRRCGAANHASTRRFGMSRISSQKRNCFRDKPAPCRCSI